MTPRSGHKGVIYTGWRRFKGIQESHYPQHLSFLSLRGWLRSSRRGNLDGLSTHVASGRRREHPFAMGCVLWWRFSALWEVMLEILRRLTAAQDDKKMRNPFPLSAGILEYI
jgi:hypothetical protein